MTQRSKAPRFELWAVFCIACGVGAYCWTNTYQPQLGRLTPGVSILLESLIGVGVVLGGIFTVLAVLKRSRQMLMSMPLFLPVWWIGSQWGDPRGWEARYEAHFAHSEQDYYRALDVALMSFRRSGEKTLKLSDELSRLTRNGTVLYHKSEEGIETVTFSVFLWGIDNERGFAWTSDGKPPVQGSVPEQLVGAKEMRPGWFVFGST